VSRRAARGGKMTARSKRADVIRPLDAAFAIDDADDTAWIARVSAALDPLFDLGLGTFSWRVRKGTSMPIEFDTMVRIEAPQPFIDCMQALHLEAAPEDYEIAYPRKQGVYSLATLYGPQSFFSSPLLRRWVHERGIVDPGALQIPLGERRLVVGGFLREVAAFPNLTRRFGDQLARRISHAFRLRQALKSRRLVPSAILTPDARVVHAEGAGSLPEARARLRQAVVARERARSSLRQRNPLLAFEMFRALVDGRFTIVDRFERDGRRFLVAYENPPAIAALRALTSREREILRRAVAGDPIKRIAIDLEIVPAAAAAYLANAREKTGLRSRQEMARWFHRQASSAPAAD
jgi:DNA-binding CsgD family transcriptional regulator